LRVSRGLVYVYNRPGVPGRPRGRLEPTDARCPLALGAQPPRQELRALIPLGTSEHASRQVEGERARLALEQVEGERPVVALDQRQVVGEEVEHVKEEVDRSTLTRRLADLLHVTPASRRAFLVAEDARPGDTPMSHMECTDAQRQL
jgi:hypothetical protein